MNEKKCFGKMDMLITGNCSKCDRLIECYNKTFYEEKKEKKVNE